MRFLLILLFVWTLAAQTPDTHAAASALPKRLAATQWLNEPKTPLPRGVVHKTFFSKAVNRDVGYLVYLPPDYGPAAGKRYPVIYNLHGAGGNELHGLEEALDSRGGDSRGHAACDDHGDAERRDGDIVRRLV
jgi:enterochelin esterase-like enzyme